MPRTSPALKRQAAMPAETNHESSQVAIDALSVAAEKARHYIQSVAGRSVAPSEKALAALSKFHEPSASDVR